jgi:hypothetical protein
MDRIDELLLDWYEWSQGYNPGTDYSAFDSTCAQFRTSRQWMDYEDLDAEVEWQRKKEVGKVVEPMMLKLDLRARVAVNTACRNFSDGAAVWSSVRVAGNQEDEYARAKAILCPMMVAAGLVEREACKAVESVL